LCATAQIFTAGAEKRRSTEQRNTVTIGVTATQDSTSDWREERAHVSAHHLPHVERDGLPLTGRALVATREVTRCGSWPDRWDAVGNYSCPPQLSVLGECVHRRLLRVVVGQRPPHGTTSALGEKFHEPALASVVHAIEPERHVAAPGHAFGDDL